MPVLWQKGIRQPQVRTNGKLRIFHEWFEARAADTDRTRVRLINATHDGAYLRGFEHLTLSEALAGLTEERARCAWQHSAIETDLRARAEKLIADLSAVYRYTSENAMLARQKNAAPQTLQQMNANDQKLKSTGIAREIAGLNAQALILKITEQGEEADAALFYSTLARAAREVRHWARRLL
jgi:hypothetical protein